MALDDAQQFCIDILSAVIVIRSRIAVVAKDVDSLMTRVPVRLRSTPHPDQVVQFIVGNKSLEHESIKLFCLLTGL
jgi:hypothetical protein